MKMVWAAIHFIYLKNKFIYDIFVLLMEEKHLK